MKGHALLIGVNEVDTSHYGEELNMNCALTDVMEMKAIFDQISSFQNSTTTFEGSYASWNNVKTQLKLLAETSQTQEGHLIIYYTGHGASLPKKNEHDEQLGFFCFYDRMVTENEIRNELMEFGKNYKILLISDSCHSGELVTWDKELLYSELKLAYPELGHEFNFDLITPKTKSIEKKRFDRIYNYKNNATFYDGLTRATGDIDFKPNAEVAILTACASNQITEQNLFTGGTSIFTRVITNAWNNNNPITYTEYVEIIKSKRPPNKKPQFEIEPKNYSDFFTENLVFTMCECTCEGDYNLCIYLEEVNDKIIKLNDFKELKGFHYMYSYSWYTNENHSQLTDILNKLKNQGCELPINADFVLGVIFVNEYINPKPFPQEILGMKSVPGAPEYGYVVIVDFYKDTILFRGRTKGKVSNTIGG